MGPKKMDEFYMKREGIEKRGGGGNVHHCLLKGEVGGGNGVDVNLALLKGGSSPRTRRK